MRHSRFKCSAGYSGKTCSISECTSVGCNELHAICGNNSTTSTNDNSLVAQCECRDGYKGSKCFTPPTCNANCINGDRMGSEYLVTSNNARSTM